MATSDLLTTAPPISVMLVVAVGCMVVLFLKKGWAGAVVHPATLICYYWASYFGPTVDEHWFEVELLNLLAFVVFLSAFGFALSLLPVGRAARILTFSWPRPCRFDAVVAPMSRKACLFLALVPLAFCAFATFVGIVIYGSLERALVHFYVGVREKEVSAWLARLSNSLYSVSVLCLFLLRRDSAMHARKFAKWLVWSSVALISIAVIPTGTVGYLTKMWIALLIADALARMKGVGKRGVRADLIGVGAAVVMAAVILLALRGSAFDSPSDVLEAIDDVTVSNGFHGIGGGHDILNEKVGRCLELFGNDGQDYLWGHTFYSIAVNPIPREWWPGKPIGFGRLLALEDFESREYGQAELAGTSFAAGLAGEGYANGGLAGVVVMSIAFGLICGLAGKIALVAFRSDNAIHVGLGLLYLQAATAFVRGDMLSAWGGSIYPIVESTVALAMIGRLLVRRRQAANAR